jgi:hypothetical protein
MAKIKYIRKDLKRELWNLFTWVGTLNDPKIRITGIACSDSYAELGFTNDNADFYYDFEIDDIKSIRGLNKLCCLWANKGKRATEDYNGKSIYDIDLNKINCG